MPMTAIWRGGCDEDSQVSKKPAEVTFAAYDLRSTFTKSSGPGNSFPRETSAGPIFV